MSATSGRRSAVVTGAAAGIGASICRALADDGWFVVAVDIAAEPLAAVVGALRPGRALGVEGDVADATTHDRAVAAARLLAPLGGWVNNAGITPTATLHEMDSADIDRTVAVNLMGTLHGCRAALTELVDTGGGAIVNISSVHASGALPGDAAYAATKGAVEALTRAICVDYAHIGVRCNAVAPGAVVTSAAAALLAAADDPHALRHMWAGFSPERRMLEAAEIAAVVSFLMSSAASAVNGAVVAADAGMAARHVALDPTVVRRSGSQ